MARCIYTLWHVDYQGKSVSLVEAIYQSALVPWLPPRVASLGFAIAFVGVWFGILSLLYKRNIVLKV
jgi:predicted acyltransferase